VSAVDASSIRKTPGVCGGEACIRDTRIGVWMLVIDRKLGMSDAEVLASNPGLTQHDLDAAWDYYRANQVEIEQALWFNDTAANIPNGIRPPAWVVVSGRLLGLPDDAICKAFAPPLSATDLDSAWAEYRADPSQLGREVVMHRLAG
jgi:uncharacterized protein (DUF433 family)